MKPFSQHKLLLFFCLFIGISFATPFYAISETTKKDTEKEIKEAVAAIMEYSKAQKDEALEKARELIDQYDHKIAAWESEMDQKLVEMKSSSRKKYSETSKKLQQQRNELSEWYGSMKYSSEQAWQEVKTGFTETYENAVNAFEAGRKESADVKQ